MGKDSIYHSDREIWGKKSKRIKGDDTIHYPNQNETRALRRIMSQTGLSEKKIRSHHKYRKILSEAQKEGLKPKYDSLEERFYRDLIKKACKDTGLVPQHPDTLVVLQCLIEELFEKRYFYSVYWWIGYTNPLKAETAVKRYGK